MEYVYFATHALCCQTILSNFSVFLKKTKPFFTFLPFLSILHAKLRYFLCVFAQNCQFETSCVCFFALQIVFRTHFNGRPQTVCFAVLTSAHEATLNDFRPPPVTFCCFSQAFCANATFPQPLATEIQTRCPLLRIFAAVFVGVFRYFRFAVSFSFFSRVAY